MSKANRLYFEWHYLKKFRPFRSKQGEKEEPAWYRSWLELYCIRPSASCSLCCDQVTISNWWLGSSLQLPAMPAFAPQEGLEDEGERKEESRSQEWGLVLQAMAGPRIRSICVSHVHPFDWAPWNDNLQRSSQPQPASHSTQTQLAEVEGRRGRSCSVLSGRFLQRNEEGKKLNPHPFNPKQFFSICQHRVGAISLWLKYKTSLSLFFYFKFDISIVKSGCNSLDFIVLLYCALAEFLEGKELWWWEIFILLF